MIEIFSINGRLALFYFKPYLLATGPQSKRFGFLPSLRSNQRVGAESVPLNSASHRGYGRNPKIRTFKMMFHKMLFDENISKSTYHSMKEMATL